MDFGFKTTICRQDFWHLDIVADMCVVQEGLRRGSLASVRSGLNATILPHGRGGKIYN